MENLNEKSKDEKSEINAKIENTKTKIKPAFYQLAIIGLICVLAATLFLTKSCPTGFLIGKSGNEIGEKTVKFINDNMIPEGYENAILKNVIKENGLYKVSLEFNGKDVFVYVSPDGKLLFPSAIPLEVESAPLEDKQRETPKTDKPNVKLFVMSFCPFGQQAENAILPVIKLLTDKIKFEPHFIVNIENDKVLSLHGDYEAEEDMRQACIIKYYGINKWLAYIENFNGKCAKNNLETCWKEAAEKAAIETVKIKDCVLKEGLELMKEEAALSEKYKVTGSPTLLINEVLYNGARTPQAYQGAICNAFIEAPSECNQVINANVQEAKGSC
ncbi:MAG: hypothetical protein QXQ79_02905 [Candidatus Nanoarchaeia archaeon]